MAISCTAAVGMKRRGLHIYSFGRAKALGLVRISRQVFVPDVGDCLELTIPIPKSPSSAAFVLIYI